MFLAALALAASGTDTACSVGVWELPIPAPPVSFLGSYAGTQLSGNWAFVPTNVTGSTLNPGAVDVFQWNGTDWAFHQNLTADIPGQDDLFGHSIATEDTRLLVGAPGWGQDRGAVYSFELTGGQWVQESRIHSSQPVNGHKFGWTCDIAGQRAIVGHGFSITTWKPVETFLDGGLTWSFETLLAPAGTSDPRGFGWAVALDGGHAAVGAHLGSESGVSFAGHVFVYALDQNGWDHETTLVPPLPTANLRFGYALDLELLPGGDLILGVGRQCVGPNTLDRGFIYERSAGSWSLELEALPGTSQCFAASVAVSPNTVAFGAPASSLSGEPAGAVHLLRRAAGGGGATTWLATGETHGDASFSLYGGGCALDGGRLLSWSTTKALVHALPESTQENYCRLTPNSNGPGAAITGLGPLSIDANAFALVVTGAATKKAGIVLGSATQAQIPFGAGNLCLGPPSGRATGLLLTDGAGAVTAPLDFTGPPLAGANIQPGTQWNFQFLFRDNVLGESVNLSDALGLQFCP